MEGGAAGLKAVFLAQRPLLLRMLTARLQSAADAEDVLQDLWLKLDQIGSRPISAPGPLLFRAATNLATDRRIAASRRAARDSAWAQYQPGPDEMPGIERAMLARETVEQANQVIERMPPRMAAALRLFRIEGRGQREIAEQLGVSVSAVEKLLRKAYHQILTVAKEHAGEEPSLRRRLESERRSGRDD
ncbi:RNA polymerase sigma factor [Sphingomonas sp. KRR8]|uniref:RNA polymerase sigma factor n=1 Tax=Sphingomonas sp. KRR8 TaxID=2942996 RepID=UPI0020213930|nr:RNA polymerase sigma factor [Sphingomonas sp. KRR8]URD61735.1 RNA polymerase sigma factor [Sphingomonas sp. KRR8]